MDFTLSVGAKPWSPGSATPSSITVTAPPSMPVPVQGAIPTIHAGAGGGTAFPSAMLGPGAGVYGYVPQPMMPSLGMPVSVQVGVSAPFIPTITSSMPTRAPQRVPRGRGNSGRGLRAQQEMKHKAASMPPPYQVVVAEEVTGQQDGTYNPLAPVHTPQVGAEEDPAAFHTKAVLGVLGDEESGAVNGPFVDPFRARGTPRVGAAHPGAIGNHSTPALAMPLTKPSPQPTPTVFVPVPTNSPFHFTVNAKPFVPPTPPSAESHSGITPPLYKAPDGETSDDETSKGKGAAPDSGNVANADALRVDADTFFTEAVDESQVKQAAKVFEKNQENPFSITSLQGVRATMPTVEPAPWYPVRYMNEDVFVPAPFKPDDGHPANGVKQHMSVCHPAQYPQAKLSLFYYLCFYCPITCQLSKITDRAPDLKLGGICGDINPACIAHLVETLSGIKLAALDVFGHNFGRCNLWLQDPSDAPRMMAALDRRVWMSPVPHGYAVVVDDDDSREYLLWYLEGLREHGPRRVRFPRHLMTCERWIV